jgi:hypothetical protein
VSESTQSSAFLSAHEWAAHWSQRWFLRPDGTDRMQFGGIDAGWATHVEAYLILFGFAWDTLGPGQRRQLSLSRFLKQRGLDRAARSLALRTRRGVDGSEAELAAIIEVPTPSMLEPAALVARAAGTASVAITDLRAGRRLESFGLNGRPLLVRWSEERRLTRAARRAMAAAWQDLESRPPEMLLQGADAASEALRRLRPLAMNSMPYLASETAALEAYLDETDPASVAIASDQHRIGRLTVTACRRRGTPTVVLQHGMPQARIGYLPVVADAVAAWSPGSARWFIDGGTDPSVVHVTGNPRFDGFAKGPSAVSAPHILLALSPTAPRTNEALVRDALSAQAATPNGRLIIKLHPGQGDWSFVRTVVRQHASQDRVEIRRFEPLGPMLAWASVVVVYRSSVALDALAAWRPVVVHSPVQESTTADHELSQLSLPISDTADALATVIGGLLAPGGAAAYFANRADALRHAVGPTSGSAERIVDLMRRLGGRD